MNILIFVSVLICILLVGKSFKSTERYVNQIENDISSLIVEVQEMKIRNESISYSVGYSPKVIEALNRLNQIERKHADIQNHYDDEPDIVLRDWSNDEHILGLVEQEIQYYEDKIVSLHEYR